MDLDDNPQTTNLRQYPAETKAFVGLLSYGQDQLGKKLEVDILVSGDKSDAILSSD